ncbi:unnamed protein product [Rhizophagus irregularis]|nr:unnamed protein product [Rhizophagus irregularis]
MIIKKIVETKSFIEEYSDVGELESSDDIGESSSNEGDEHIEKIYRNYWLENGHEINIEEIRRIINFRIEYEIIKTRDFIENYMTIKELDDEGVIEEFRRWYNTNAMECPLCNKMILMREAVEYNEEFIGKICRSCSEREEEDIDGIDKRIRELKKICDEMKIIITEGELLRLTSMGYTDGEILDEEFIEIFQENKNELEEELRKKLDKLLKEQAGIMDSEESGEKSDNEESEEDNTDDSEKIGEILSPEEYEIWEENIKDFNENEFENNNENVINTEGFGLSQNSDLNNSLNIKNSNIENSDIESEIFDYNLQELFQENILFKMATVDEMRDLFRTFARNQYGNDLGNDLGTANSNLINNALGNINATRGLVVEFPLFGGSENEDAGEWVQRFTDAYTTNALADDNVNRFRIAKGCLVGTARDWLRTEGANIDNWGAGNNDTSLDRRVVSKYASDEIKERWQDELENIKQGDRESVTGYVTRFRNMVKKAGGDAAVPAGSQKRIFMKGLSLEYIRGVYATRPANLNEAITAARNQETGIKAVAARFSGKEIVEEKNIEEIMKEETNKYKKENEIYKKMQKPVNEKDINDMSKMLEQFKAEILNGIERNQPRGNVNRNTNTRNARIIRCFECNEEGHIRPECPQLRQKNNYRTQNNFNRNNNNERRNNNNNRNINLMDYERYNNNNRYNDNEYYNNYNNYEKEMYPTLRSGRTYNRDINNDYNEMEIEDVPIPPKREYDMKMDIDGKRKGGFSNKEDRDKAYQSRRRYNQCKKCGLRGHFRRECPNPGMKRGNKNIRVRVNVPPEKFIKDMYNEKADITYGQIYSENPKYRRIARDYDYEDYNENSKFRRKVTAYDGYNST